MKDYLVHAADHSIEVTCVNYGQATREASSLKRQGYDDVTIDQYEDNELTGVYWIYGKNDFANRLVRQD